MLHAQTGVKALLFLRFQLSFRRAGALAFLDELSQLRIGLRQFSSQRMLGRHAVEGCAEDRVRTGRKDHELLVTAFDGQRHLRAFGLADPVFLHQADFVRPALKIVLDGVEQLRRVVGDLEEPLRQLALFHQRTRPPAATVFDLLVGQNRHLHRVPVHPALFLVHEALAVHLDEHALLLFVVLGITGGELTGPVDGQAHGLQLSPHRVDVLVGPIRRVNLALKSSVLRRQTKGIPTNRVQHVKAPRPLVARNHIAQRVVAHVAHVDGARWVREHLQHVVFFAACVGFRAESLLLIPGGLPLLFGQ